MAIVVWTDEAIEGLKRIYAWIASEKPATAADVAAKLVAAADSLTDFPQRGREIAPGVRQLTYASPYLIHYSYDPIAEVVTIETVWHGAREF